MSQHEKVIIVDFGSQYTKLIARTVRECHIYSEIVPAHRFSLNKKEAIDQNVRAIILSGGPASVGKQKSPTIDPGVFNLGLPVLGVCYGMQLMAHQSGGTLHKSPRAEFGKAKLRLTQKDPLFSGIPTESIVWMSHNDHVLQLPTGFVSLAQSDNSPIAVMRHKDQPLYGIQFHPEVKHTEHGVALIRNFLVDIAKCKRDWKMTSFINDTISDIRERVGNKHVICALSGGVDSTVTAMLIHRAIGKQLTCVFIDNGLLRKHEAKAVVAMFKKELKFKLIHVDATAVFLKQLKGVTDPEVKRKKIGHEFIRQFDITSKKIKNVSFLAQGTLYPDRIESGAVVGPAATIKTHHNVGGLPKNMKLSLIEPLRELFKDEVREVGKMLGLPDSFIHRQPFPGPGLAVRVLGEITPERLEILRNAEAVLAEEMLNTSFTQKIWQLFCVLLPIRSVGVMGDGRTYAYTIAIRGVESGDGMTANWVKLPYEFLETVSNRIVNEVRGVNRVVYDITNKPPATIEWE